MINKLRIEIDLGRQVLRLRDLDAVHREYPISSARNGPGEQMDSECTPRGLHVVAEKIGAGALPNTVFVARRATGERHSPAFAASQPLDRDWIVTRILWLAGCEPGRNLGGDRDTHARFIYIHGTPHADALGRPGSRGCIRMSNDDVIDLFDRVPIGTLVRIDE